MSKKSSGFLLGAFIGGAAAAAAALLLAPRSGKELRGDLIDQLDDVSEGRASELAGIAQMKGSEVSEFAKQKRDEYGWLEDKVSSHVTAAKSASEDLLGNLSEKTADLQDEFKRTSNEMKSRVSDLIEEDIILKEEDITEDLYAALDTDSDERA